MPFKRYMKGVPSDILAADGLLYQDWSALTPCQRECITRVGMTIQLEQEAYLTQHPEVIAMIEIFLSKMARLTITKDFMNESLLHFTKPFENFDGEIRKRLNVPLEGSYKEGKDLFQYHDIDLECDLRKIISKYYPPPPCQAPPTVISTPNTLSSSFLSLITSATTLPTPEPVPTPEPTLSQTMFALVSNTVDKAIFSRVDDQALRYDTAYVELSKAVEEAMEIPVIEIKEDIAELFFKAYDMFELNIMEKERIAAAIAWEKRMRKKMKRTLRRIDNFRGYETPPTPKSSISTHESYIKPPPRPCICSPQYHYNRYPKDRFGIYLPREVDFSNVNVTATPAISLESVTDTKSVTSKKSAVSAKSTVSRRGATTD